MAIYTTYVSSSGAGAHTDIGGSITGSLFIQGEANSPHTGKLVVNTISGSMTDMFPGLVISGSTGVPGDLGRIIMSGTVEFEHKLEIKDAITSNSSLHMSSSNGLFDVSAHPSPVSEGVKFRLSNSSNVINNNYILGQIQFAATKDTDGPRGVAASILARAPEGYDGSMHSTGVPADLEFYADDLATPKLFVSSSGRVGIGTAAPATKLHVDGVTRSVTSVQTPLIEYTDGDDAIEISDGGFLTFPKGILESPSVYVGQATSANKWFKIASLKYSMISNQVSQASFMVQPTPINSSTGANRGAGMYIITVRITTETGPVVQTQGNATFVTVEYSGPSTDGQRPSWHAKNNVVLNYESDGAAADLWFRVPNASGFYGNLYVTPVVGTSEASPVAYKGPPWVINAPVAPTTLPATNEFEYGQYASKIFGVVTGSQFVVSGGNPGHEVHINVDGHGALSLTGSYSTTLGFAHPFSNTEDTSFIDKLIGGGAGVEGSGGLAITGSYGTNSQVFFHGDQNSRVFISANTGDPSLTFTTPVADGTQQERWAFALDESRDNRLGFNPGSPAPGTDDFLSLKSDGPNILMRYSRNALADVGDPANYFMHVVNNDDTLGQGAGIAFTSDAPSSAGIDDPNVGGSIILKNAGAESKGTLQFYTKQSTVEGDTPTLAMEIAGGQLNLQYGMQFDGGTLKDSGTNDIITFDGSGNIETIAPVLDQLTVIGTDNTAEPVITLVSTNTTNHKAGQLQLDHYHGSAGEDGVNLGEIKFRGSNDGSTWGVGASIQGVGDGDWSTDDYPGRLEFYTTREEAGAGTLALTIHKDQQADFTGNVTVGGGYGSTGTTISTAGVLETDSSITCGNVLYVIGDSIADSSLTSAITFDGAANTTVAGDLTVDGDDIKDSGGNTILSSDGNGYIDDRPTFRNSSMAYPTTGIDTSAPDTNDFLNISGYHYYTTTVLGLASIQGGGQYRGWLGDAAENGTGSGALNTTDWTFTNGTGASELRYDYLEDYTYFGGSKANFGKLYILRDTGTPIWQTANTFGAGTWYVRYRGMKANTSWEEADEIRWQVRTDGGSWTTVHTVYLDASATTSAGNLPIYDDATKAYGCSVDSFTFTVGGTSSELRGYRYSGNTNEWVAIWEFQQVMANDGSRYPCLDIMSPVGGPDHSTQYLMRFFTNDATTSTHYPDGTITLNDGTVSYNQFTGQHGGKVTVENMKYSKGSIVRITGIDKTKNEPVYEIEETTSAQDKAVIGVYNSFEGVGGVSNCGIAAVGNGYILVCDEGGDIEVGDYICSSNIKGHGMKQESDQMMNYTVAKAAEPVDWSTITSSRWVITGTDEEGEQIGEHQQFPATQTRINCTFHCG